MTTPIRLEHVDFASVVVTEHTEWTFARIHDSTGAAAEVEITSGANTGKVVKFVDEMVSRLSRNEVTNEEDIAGYLSLDRPLEKPHMSLGTAVSTLRTGVFILQSIRSGINLTKALGEPPQPSVHLYANINRCLLLTPRTPTDFAEAAESAVLDGFQTVKCAPFDEVIPPNPPDKAVELAVPGIKRVAAVRNAIGSGVHLLVDCHSRFDPQSAPQVAEQLEKFDVAWFEEPVQPTKDASGLARISKQVPMPVAGGEHGYGEDFFMDLITSEAVDVIMPDVKHCGGAVSAHKAGHAAMEQGGNVSLHSPSGPLSQLTSAHVTAAMPGAMPLESAVYETVRRKELLTPAERIEGGNLWIPAGVGLGATLSGVSWGTANK